MFHEPDPWTKRLFSPGDKSVDRTEPRGWDNMDSKDRKDRTESRGSWDRMDSRTKSRFRVVEYDIEYLERNTSTVYWSRPSTDSGGQMNQNYSISQLGKTGSIFSYLFYRFC